MRPSKLIFILSVFVFVFGLAFSAYAQSAPELPHLFYGTSKVNGEDTPAGTLIIAKVDDAEKGRITTTESGKYGGQAANQDKLSVGDDITDDATIEFQVSTVAAVQTASYDSGEIDELDLTWDFPDEIVIEGDVINEPILCIPGTDIIVNTGDLSAAINCTEPTPATINNISNQGSSFFVANPVPGGWDQLSDAFEINITGDVDITATITYDDSEIEEEDWDLNILKLVDGEWEVVTDIVSIDTDENTITFNVNPGSTYAAGGIQEELPFAGNIANQTVFLTPNSKVVINNSGLSIVISSNSFTNANILNVSNLGGTLGFAAQLPGGGVQQSSNIFEISITGNVSITVTVPYNETGIDESTAWLYKVVDGVWVRLPADDFVSLDTEANTITFTIASGATPFSIFSSTPAVSGDDGDDGGGGGTPGTGGGGGGGGGAALALPEEPEEEEAVEEEEEEIEEEVPEEEPELEVAGPEEPEEAPPAGLGAITGAVIGAAGNAGIVSLVIIAVIIAAGFGFSRHYGGMPGQDHFTRAANLHKKANQAYKNGRHKKALSLYKKAQELREAGERRLR